MHESHWRSVADNIGYEFEIETEVRYVIEPGNMDDFTWVNHFVDTYDKAGRVRVRIKNGEPRLSIKVPLFTRDTDIAKTCIRIEFKPKNGAQKKDLLHIRDLIVSEAGAQISEKWGAPITLSDGKEAWINRDTKGNWWIEFDADDKFVPPDTIRVIGTQKSTILT